MKYLKEADLPEFVLDIDVRGGPTTRDSVERWSGWQYLPTVQVDQSLDPLGSKYIEAMNALYCEIRGKSYDVSIDEHTDFDLDKHAAGFSSYVEAAPADIALHFQRLSLALRCLDLKKNSSVLDLGCGWGFSSEMFAQCGCDVTAVDINPSFVELIRRRANRLSYRIKSTCSSFQDFDTENKFDAIVFYECFHHEREPWLLARKLERLLGNNGQIVLAGEPIQDIWWKAWGLRLDPLSIYCIRKFGWFESGWSENFLTYIFGKAGLYTKTYRDADPSVGTVMIAERPGKLVPSKLVTNSFGDDGWYVEGGSLVSNGRSTMALYVPSNVFELNITVSNFRGKPIKLTINSSGWSSDFILSPGTSEVKLPANEGRCEYRFSSEVWIPEDELGNGDLRSLSFHLTQVSMIS